MLNVATESAAASAPIPSLEAVEPVVIDTRYADYKIIRRNGAVVGFAPNKIAIAVTKAFIAVQGGQAAASARIRELVESITSQVTQALLRRTPNGGTFHIEDIQDQVELALMRSGEHEVARAYVLYREKRAQERAALKAAGAPEVQLHVIEDGQKKPLDTARLEGLLADACTGLGDNVKAEPIMHTVLRDLYDGVPMAEVEKALVLAARSMIEQDPAYSLVTARLLLNSIRHEVLGEAVTQAQMGARYADYFPTFIKRASPPNCSTRNSASLIWHVWPRCSTPAATTSSATWVCRPCTTATSCTSRNHASNCRRPSSCAWRWAWRSTRSTAKRAPSSSTRCCPRSIS